MFEFFIFFVGFCAVRVFSTSVVFCFTAFSFIDYLRVEECGRTARDWKVVLFAVSVRDLLGEVSWVFEFGGDLENFYV